MSDETNPNAQDPNAPEGQPVVEVVEEKVPAGIQKRIDELTAEKHDLARKAQEANERLLQTLAAQAQAPRIAAPPEETFEEVDPMVKRLIEASMRGLKAQNTALVNEVAGMRAANEARALVAGIEDPTVREAAATYAQNFRAKGLNISAQEAASFAIGDAIMKGTYQPGGNNVAPRRGAAPIGGGVRAPSLATARKSQLPDNFGDLDPDAQIAALQKRGVDDDAL